MLVASPGQAGYRPGYERLAERIVELIATDGLQPGDRLPTEQALAAQLGAGRAMVRDALKLLSATGRVRTRRGSGIFVADPARPPVPTAIDLSGHLDIEHILGLFEYRAMLEGETARLAAGRATPSELRAIQAAAAGTRIAAERDDSPNFGPADSAFHVGVATAAHNPFLVTSVETVYRLLQHAVGLSVPRGVGSLAVAAGQHAAVCAAIEDGQLGPAEVAMRQHTETSAATFRHAVRHHFVSLIGGGPPANE